MATILGAVIRSEPQAVEQRPRLLPRVEAARVIVSAEAALMALVGLQSIFQPPIDLLAMLLSFAAAAVLGWGVWRIGRDASGTRVATTTPPGKVPWDWTDVVLFWPMSVVGAIWPPVIP